MSLSHVRIVLSRPSEPRNVGATCRAMKNSGVSRLVIASPEEPDLDAARRLAVGATDVLESANLVTSLPEAVEGCSLVAGITRRTGQRRKTASFSPRQFAEKVCAAGAEVAVVFGNEQSGLSDDELELCHLAVSIPSSPEQPSLNLSHAVQVIAYELYLADLALAERDSAPGGASIGAESHVPVDAAELDNGIARIVAALEQLGFHTQEGPQGMPSFLRDILGRSMLSEAELSRLRSLFEKLEGMHRSANE